MTYEVEIKFRCSELPQVRDRALAAGAVLLGTVEQKDRYFNHPGRDFIVTDEALRLRDDGQTLTLTYKGPKADSETKTRREIEIAIAGGRRDLDRATELLLALGFGIVATVAKARTCFRIDAEGGAIEVAFDQVQEVGEFVELEIQSDEAGLDQARKRVWDLARRLGLHDSERRSYLELLLAGRNAGL